MRGLSFTVSKHSVSNGGVGAVNGASRVIICRVWSLNVGSRAYRTNHASHVLISQGKARKNLQIVQPRSKLRELRAPARVDVASTNETISLPKVSRSD